MKMKEFQIGNWGLKVAKERTEAYYEQDALLETQCSCEDCVHYIAATSQFSLELKALFKSLGIDPHKEGEFFVIDETEQTSHYMAFYHFVGDICRTGEELLSCGEATIRFTDRLDLVPEDFPRPIVQLHIEIKIPKILNSVRGKRFDSF